jgi:hypothetical protein
LAVLGLNRWKDHVGWFFLGGLIILFFVAHVVEEMTYGTSLLFP